MVFFARPEVAHRRRRGVVCLDFEYIYTCVYSSLLLLCRNYAIGETATGWILGLIGVVVWEVRIHSGDDDDDDDDDDDEYW